MENDHGIGMKTRKGLKWNSVNVISQTVITFFVMIIMARLLTPQDFGLVTLSMVFVGLAEKFSTLGVGPYLIQKEKIEDSNIKSSFTISLIIGFLIYFLLYLSTPIISIFLEEEKIKDILPTIALIFLTKSLLTVNQSILIRRMQYKNLFIVEISTIVVGNGITPIFLALNGYGFWSLIIGMLTYSTLKMILLQIIVKTPIGFYFNYSQYKDILWYGGGVTLLGLLNYAANNVDNLIIGRYMGTANVGLYNRSAQLMKLPLTKISQTISNVLFSSYSRFQNDLEKLELSYLSAITYISLLTYPILVGMIIGADYIVIGLYGEKWVGAVQIFQILCFSGFFKVIFNLSGAITKATRKVYNEALRQFIYLISITIGCLLTVSYGISYIATIIVFSSLYMYLSMSRLCIKILNSSWRKLHKAQFPAVVISFLFFIIATTIKILMDKYLLGLDHSIKLIVFIVLCAIALISLYILIPGRISKFKSEELEKIKENILLYYFKVRSKIIE